MVPDHSERYENEDQAESIVYAGYMGAYRGAAGRKSGRK